MTKSNTKNNTVNHTGLKILRPDQIKAGLDQYVIGQEEAKITLSVAAYNHYKRVTDSLLVPCPDPREAAGRPVPYPGLHEAHRERVCGLGRGRVPGGPAPQLRL